jgi:hypothetical protein
MLLSIHKLQFDINVYNFDAIFIEISAFEPPTRRQQTSQVLFSVQKAAFAQKMKPPDI